MTLLTICQTVVEEISELDPISYIAGNTGDDSARQLLAFANKTGRELARQYAWQELLRTHTFSTVDGTADYALPSDYSRMADDTAWDTTAHRRMNGNTNPLRWRALAGQATVTSLNFFYRLRANRLWIYPTPSSAVAMEYDYQSKNWCESAGGVGQTAFAADTDVALIPEDLIALGIKYYFKDDNGMDTTSALEEYKRAFVQYKTQNVPCSILDMGASVYNPRAEYQDNIPDVIDA